MQRNEHFCGYRNRSLNRSQHVSAILSTLFWYLVTHYCRMNRTDWNSNSRFHSLEFSIKFCCPGEQICFCRQLFHWELSKPLRTRTWTPWADSDPVMVVLTCEADACSAIEGMIKDEPETTCPKANGVDSVCMVFIISFIHRRKRVRKLLHQLKKGFGNCCIN